MKSIYNNPSELEKSAKEKYCFPDYIMMENAASAMEIVVDSVIQDCKQKISQILIVCGAGNNGADGLALARRLHSKYEVQVLLLAQPKTNEGKTQYLMSQKVGVNFLTQDDFSDFRAKSDCFIIIDCIFGTGFHGNLPADIAKIIEKLNSFQNAIRIACDISSGLKFNSDITVTMGSLKTSLFSDEAKNVSGKIFIADLGIGHADFEKCLSTDTFLLEQCDTNLPFRKEKSSHKGKFGHACIFAGEKSGAAILAAEAALAFGAGLVSLIKSENSNLAQFKISPYLMVSKEIPAKTTAILLGSGLGPEQACENAANFLTSWFTSNKQNANPKTGPACVLDADMMNYPKLKELLTKLNSIENARIIITPHLKELSSFCSICELGTYSVSELSSIETRRQIGLKAAELFPRTAIIMKSANSLISVPTFNSESTNSFCEFFVCADGNQSLAKAGSGDVLAGLCVSLLAQGYDIKKAAIAACESHALASEYDSNGNTLCSEDFSLTAQSLIKNLL